jgi:hypothetical protein
MKQLSIILLSLLLAAMVRAQIPNNGFESWSSVKSYAMPDFWDNLNPSTAGSGIFTCTKGAPGSPGNFYLKLTSKDIPVMGVLPGIAVCGVLNQETHLPVSGFPYGQRPQSFNGKWQYMMYGSGIGYIDINLTRWDVPSHTKQVVANCHKVLTGMVMSWANFTIPFVYYNGQFPDTCMIFLSASGSVPTDNDYLYLDNLQFQGSVTGITPIPSTQKVLTVFPNPATGKFSVQFVVKEAGQTILSLFDSQGRLVGEQKVQTTFCENTLDFDIKYLPAGLYFLKMVSKNSEISARVMIQ